MPYFPDLNTYLHQSSLLLQAYPSTARITTKYSLPKPTKSAPAPTSTTEPKRDPAATLTLKTYDPHTGLCLKYRTDKAAEVGRLLSGMGRLARGELIEMPTTTKEEAAGEKMDVDSAVPAAAAPAVVEEKQSASAAAGGGGKSKKKKGKK